MGETFGLDYKPEDAIRGLEQLKAQLKELEAKLGVTGSEAVDAAQDIDKVGDEAAETSTDLSKLTTQVDTLSGSYGKVSQKTQDFAKSLNSGNSSLNRTKDLAGGLDAILTTMGFGTLGAVAGNAERLATGAKDLNESLGGVAGTMARVAVAGAAVAAIGYSIYSVFRDLTGQVDENNTALQNWGAKIGDMFTKLTEGAEGTAGSVKDVGEGMKEAMEAANKAGMEAGVVTEQLDERVKRLKATLDNAYKAEQIDKYVDSLRTIVEVEIQIQNVSAGIEAIRNREATTIADIIKRNEDLAAATEAGEQKVAKLIERRAELQQKQLDDAKALVEEEKERVERQKENAARRTEEVNKEREERREAHKERMEQLEDEREKQRLMAAEQEKAKKDAHQQEAERIKALQQGNAEATKKEIDGIKQVEQAKQGSASGGKYGEGQAPTAGQEDPFTAALKGMAGAGSLGDLGSDGSLPAFGYWRKGAGGRPPMAGGAGEPVAGGEGQGVDPFKIIQDRAAEEVSRGDVLRRAAENWVGEDSSRKEKEEAARKFRQVQEGKKTGQDATTDDDMRRELSQAQEDLVNAEVEKEAKRLGVDEKMLELFKEQHESITEAKDRAAETQRQLDELLNLSRGQRTPNAPRSGGSSRASTQRRASR